MGRLGGGEQGYGSDADVMFVHDPGEGVDEEEARPALEVVKELSRLLGAARARPAPRHRRRRCDPRARTGRWCARWSRSAYYERWSLVWEAQALLRAAPVAGDPGLAERFVALIDPMRYPDGGLDAGQVREIRTLKARMEAERLPRGADRKTHVKLGRGGLTDVEWTVQLLQLQHAHAHPELRTASTLAALDGRRAARAGRGRHAADLAAAWRAGSSMRNAGVLFRGRALDAVPSDPRDADGIARILGLPGGSGQELAERYRRVARRARAAHEAELYDA